MVATSFLTASDASKEAYKTANLLKSLSVNALIGGEHGTGKTALARSILPDAPLFDARNFDTIFSALPTTNTLIITNIEKSPNLARLYDLLNEHKVRVVATTSKLMQLSDDFFSIRLQLPPLRERPEDVLLLQQKFIEEAKSIFGISRDFKCSAIVPDLTDNAYSLRRQITIHYLLSDINEKELMGVMESFLLDKLGSNNDYRKFLHLYEVPLIRAGMKRFKSQLKLAERLGLNRNTLRKKISEYSGFDLEIEQRN